MLSNLFSGNFSLIKTNWMQMGLMLLTAGRKDAVESTMNAYKAAKV